MTLTTLLVMLWSTHPVARPAAVRADRFALATTPAEWLRHRSVIFVGDVVAIRNEHEQGHHYHVVTFTVTESFRGVTRGERTLRFNDPGLEGFRFREESQRVLVVAGTLGRNRHSTTCSPTRALLPGDPFLNELRRLTRR
jgi:hypothetical protein